jgi:hypothetical protein
MPGGAQRVWRDLYSSVQHGFSATLVTETTLVLAVALASLARERRPAALAGGGGGRRWRAEEARGVGGRRRQVAEAGGDGRRRRCQDQCLSRFAARAC